MAISLMLVACVVPGPGLMWQFGHALAMPHMYERTETGWKEDKLLSYAPDIMLTDPGRTSKEYDRIVGGFKQGLRRERYLPFRSIPWHGWTRT